MVPNTHEGTVVLHLSSVGLGFFCFHFSYFYIINTVGFQKSLIFQFKIFNLTYCLLSIKYNFC